ncbi:hypothetical protein [Kitasatospora sp. NPDC058190]|uniref:hypothetical protein n=1 Tax=Kitasatospora sp. NPDC058190 TaxID=3346371 RepID=UPI0036DAFDA4
MVATAGGSLRGLVARLPDAPYGARVTNDEVGQAIVAWSGLVRSQDVLERGKLPFDAAQVGGVVHGDHAVDHEAQRVVVLLTG